MKLKKDSEILFKLLTNLYNKHESELPNSFKTDILKAAKEINDNGDVGLISSNLYRSILMLKSTLGIREIEELYEFVKDRKNPYELKQNIGNPVRIRFF